MQKKKSDLSASSYTVEQQATKARKCFTHIWVFQI